MHEFDGSKWITDETHHWHAAICEHTGERKDVAEHVKGSGTTMVEATTEKSGKMLYKCTICERFIIDDIPQIAIEVSAEKPLKQTLIDRDLQKTTSLKLAGTLSADDFKTLKEMTTLESLDISEVTNDTIPANAFEASYFKTIKLPKGLKSIEDDAFRNSNLIELIIPEGVTEIGNRLLFDSKKLTKLVIPGSVEIVGRWILQVTSKDVHGNHYIDSSIPDVTLVLSEGIKELAPSAFWGSAIKEVIIPSSITVISDWCFSNSRLEKITFHDNITKIGGWAFESCKLKFENNKLILPKNTKVLGPFAFYLYYAQRNEIVLNDNLEVIYQGALITCINKTLEIPASVKKLYRGTFVVDPDGLDSVVFRGETPPEYCKNIDPENITYNEATGEYEGPLDTVPPKIEINDKIKEKYKNLKAYVPAASLEAYKTALLTDTDFEPFKSENIIAK